jgi:hypothetical protein
VISFYSSSLTFFSVKGDERKVENPEGTTHALGFGSGVIGTGDLFGASQQTSKKSTGRDFGFDFSTSLAQDTKMFHTHTKNEQNDTKKVPHSSPDDGVDSDEESWEFKDAFSETRSKEKVIILFILFYFCDSTVFKFLE